MGGAEGRHTQGIQRKVLEGPLTVALAQLEGEGIPSVARAVELGAVQQCAHIVHCAGQEMLSDLGAG
jgi:hypothetical protein